MYLNSFSVRVPEGTEKESGYVELNHGKQYSINLRNDRDVRCDADVSIDGKPIGTFRIEPNSTINLERPLNEDKRFTFYKAGSREAKASDEANIKDNYQGLIQVTFRPEKQYCHYLPSWWYVWPSTPAPYTPWNFGESWDYDTTCNTRGTSGVTLKTSGVTTTSANYCQVTSTSSLPMRAGVTGLSGHSDQEFCQVDEIQDYDTNYFTAISLRLVCTENQRQDPTPLRPVAYSNPVPPPVSS